MINFRELVKKGVHFGHKTSRWCPKMAPYLWGVKNKTHLIDVSKTAYQAEKAAQFLEQVAARGEIILWVGTKKAAQDTIHAVANELNLPFVTHRWIGGTLSNYAQVKKSVTKLLHYEDVLARADQFSNYTKKELNVIQKMVMRLEKSIGGLRKLVWPVGAVVLVDVQKEQSALLEASQMRIPVVAIVDTNGDPSLVDYVIPGNDDAPQSISYLLDYLKEAVARGRVVAGSKVVEVALDTTEDRGHDVAVLTLETEEEVAAKKKPRKAPVVSPRGAGTGAGQPRRSSSGGGRPGPRED
jgi:small subunit ribosomal protein S2